MQFFIIKADTEIYIIQVHLRKLEYGEKVNFFL